MPEQEKHLKIVWILWLARRILPLTEVKHVEKYFRDHCPVEQWQRDFQPAIATEVFGYQFLTQYIYWLDDICYDMFHASWFALIFMFVGKIDHGAQSINGWSSLHVFIAIKRGILTFLDKLKL
jgi:hypothetical protein